MHKNALKPSLQTTLPNNITSGLTVAVAIASREDN